MGLSDAKRAARRKGVEAARRKKFWADYNALSDVQRQRMKAEIEAALTEWTPAKLKKMAAKQIAGRQLKPEPITSTIRAALEHAATAVLKVSNGGRGFVVEKHNRRYVITAAHCLIRNGKPYLPPCITASYTDERTYPKLLGPLGKRKLTVWAECLFADPVGDIAVLEQPDIQMWPDEAEAYDELVGSMGTLRIGDIPKRGAVWLLNLDRQWKSAAATLTGCGLELPRDSTVGGMSGSPIVTSDGAAFGLVACTATNPRLTERLLRWMVHDDEGAQRPRGAGRH